LPTSKDLPSSLVQLRIAVWTGVTRDTRPICDIGGSFFCDAQPLLSPDDMLGCGPRLGDEAHEAARVHHPSRRRSGGLAARCAGAATRAHAANWRPHEFRSRRSRRACPDRGASARSHGAGLARGPTLQIDIRGAGDDAESSRKDAAELLALGPDVLVATTTAKVHAVRVRAFAAAPKGGLIVTTGTVLHSTALPATWTAS
jgi:hypothetical protein